MANTFLIDWKKIILILLFTIHLPINAQTHQFKIGTADFLLDGNPFQIRCGEIHFARIPREYWENRLKLCKAMGLNTVCAYLFWNYHEFEQGKFDWNGQKDVAEFCRLAQKEGLWVILRPGPYTCAEWEMGGLPWWLLKNPDIKFRTTDSVFMSASRKWLNEVHRVLGSLQITQGGPIIMAQVENEYGYYGEDSVYMGQMRQAILQAGFNVPLFACNPPFALKKGFRSDLFNVVNFGNDPEAGFKALREIQPAGPLMCGEFYPGWFDTWGMPHHLGKTDNYLSDLEYMLKNHASFSIYMVHGGTTFGLWAGCDRPFKPDVSSYDYDAPISEAGWIGEKFEKTRELMSRYLLPGETIPKAPKGFSVIEIPAFTLNETALVFENLPNAINVESPSNMEAYNHGSGMINYRTTLHSGTEGFLEASEIRDFAWIFLDGKQIGVMDRRYRKFKIKLPRRTKDAQLDILVYSMGRINFGMEAHDRKGLYSPVVFRDNHQKTTRLNGWQVFPLDLQPAMLSQLSWKTGPTKNPAFWRGSFTVQTPGDVFLDLSKFGKGVVWVNDICLGRYWNIGPSQTMYVPGVWIKQGQNKIVVLDIIGPQDPSIRGLSKPVLDKLRPELDFTKNTNTGILHLQTFKPVFNGTFDSLKRKQDVHFDKYYEGSQFCIEAMNAFDKKDFAAIAELELIGTDGNAISNANWKIVFADSEELSSEDGSASNAINGQAQDYWHTQWSGDNNPKYPHTLIIDLGMNLKISGFRYISRPGGNSSAGKIKDYKIFIGNQLVTE